MDTHREDILDIRRLVVESRDRLELLNNEKRFKFHVEQCKSLCTYTMDKLSTYIDCNNGQYLDGGVRSERVERAWKEVYRAMKEAETYLNHCSTDTCRIKCFILANAGEAFTLHMHDLAWSFICLDLAFICYFEEWNDSLHLRKFGNSIRFFFAEMSRLHVEQFGLKFHDYWHLLMACNQTAAKAWTLTQKNKIGILLFMERKLLGTIRNECNIESGNDIPTWLQIPAKDLIKRKTIGEGSFGKVYEGSWLGHRVAIKYIPIDAHDLFDTETKVLAKLQSPFIVQLIGTCIEGSHCSIVMELVRSSLDKLIMNSASRGPLALPVAVDIMLQILRGMEYLHRQGIMHMDLKASNVLIEPSAVPEFRKQGYGRVKLCDFGMASLRLTSFRCEDPEGTCYWRAPEAFPFPNEELLQEIDSLKEYTYKADVYSFAMTCYEILTGEQPFLGVNPKDLDRMIVQGRRPPLQGSSCPAVLADAIATCWETDPRRRPCFAQVSTFMRNMKFVILKWNDPSMTLSVPLRSKEEAFDEIPEDEKLESITRVLHIIPSDIKSRYNINVAGTMPPEKSNDTILMFHHKKACFDLDDFLFRMEDLEEDSFGFAYTQLTQLMVFQNMKYPFDMDDILESHMKFLRIGINEIWTTYRADSDLVVKRSSQDATYVGHKRYYETYLQKLSGLEHTNLMSLLGYHISKEETVLVYNYLPKGSLWSLVHTKEQFMTWDRRKEIAVDVALGLAFLHESGMVHGNVKSSNVLLDDNGRACLADSCLWRLVKNSSVAHSGLVDPEKCSSGSWGYMASKQFYSGKVSEESDVYSFGVLLLGFTGKNPIKASTHLPKLIFSINDERWPMEMLDRELRSHIDIPNMWAMYRIAKKCTCLHGHNRPRMSEVVEMITHLSKMSKESTFDESWAQLENVNTNE